MEDTNHNVRLTAPELANLWTQFQTDSMSICVIDHSLQNVEDKAVYDILEFAIGLSKSHIEKIKEFYHQEDYPVPKGFTNNDVDLEAPQLFSDSLTLYYMYIMSLHGLTGYAASLGTSVRADQRRYFIQCYSETMELYDKIVEAMLQKGIFSRPPILNPPEQIDFVKNQSYLRGWLGEKRPLTGTEIDGLTFNSQKLMVKIVLEIGFSQVTQSKECRKYFQRGAQLCKNQVKILDGKLVENDLPSPKKWTSEVTSSTTPPFSEKLMLFHIITLVSAAVGFYGAAMAVVQRRDLAVMYERLIAKVGLYAEDGIELMIKNGWLEQPPMADDRKQLANKK